MRGRRVLDDGALLVHEGADERTTLRSHDRVLDPVGQPHLSWSGAGRCGPLSPAGRRALCPPRVRPRLMTWPIAAAGLPGVAIRVVGCAVGGRGDGDRKGASGWWDRDVGVRAGGAGDAAESAAPWSGRVVHRKPAAGPARGCGNGSWVSTAHPGQQRLSPPWIALPSATGTPSSPLMKVIPTRPYGCSRTFPYPGTQDQGCSVRVIVAWRGDSARR